MPTAVSSFGAAVDGNFLFVYGGHAGATHTYSTETASGKFLRLNLAKPAKGWEDLPGGTPLQGLALVAHRGKIYRIGGMQPMNKPGEKADNRSTKTCSVYNRATGRWEPFVDMPSGRSSHDAAVVGDLLVVVGGWDMLGAGKDDVWLDTALVMDLSQKNPQWTSIKQPFKKRALNTATLGDKVYVVGGMTWENEIDKSIDILDPGTRSWSTGPTLPGPTLNGFSPAVCSIGDYLYASPADGKIYRFAPAQSGWKEFGSLAQKRLVHRLVPFGDRLFAIGGARRRERRGDRSRDADADRAATYPRDRPASLLPDHDVEPDRRRLPDGRVPGSEDPRLLRQLSQALEGGAGGLSRRRPAAATQAVGVAGPEAGAAILPCLPGSSRVVEGSVDRPSRSNDPLLQRDGQGAIPRRSGEVRSLDHSPPKIDAAR